MRYRIPRIVLLIVVLVGCAGPGTRSQSAEPQETSQAGHSAVLLVGVDGLEWDVVLPMLREGRLPNLEKLMREGVYGQLESTLPTASPIIWTSVATGQVAGKHGILGFVQKDEEGRRQNLYTSLDRRSKAIWNVLSDFDRRVAVVGWWLTYPVEPINGVMVAQVNTLQRDQERFDNKILKGALYEGLEDQVHPPGRQAEVLSLIPGVEEELPGVLKEIFGDMEPLTAPVPALLWEKCLWAFRADEIYRRVAIDLLEDEGFDLAAVYIGGTDVVGHRFWRYMHPETYTVSPSEEHVQAFGDVIPAYYAHADRIVGELMGAAPEDSIVMVVSDHGMRAENTGGGFESEEAARALRSGGHHDAPPGVFIASGPGVRRPTSAQERRAPRRREDLPVIGSVLDVTPTLLALLELPIGRDMDGEVMPGVIVPAFLDEHPLRLVDSHTPAGWHEARAADPVETVGSEERIEQLRALGYIGGGDEE